MSFIDLISIILLLPVFIVRYLHWIYGRILFRSRKAVDAVDSFEKEFKPYLSLVEIRKGRKILQLHIPASERLPPRGLLIFIHGSCARMQQFVNQIRFFHEAGYEIVSYDAFGCGLSEKPTDSTAYVSKELYQDFLEVVNAFTVKKGVKAISIIGHSFGGIIALKYAASNESAKSTSSIVAICPPSFSCTRLDTSIFKWPISLIWLIRPFMDSAASTLLFGPNASPALIEQEKEASMRNPVHMFRSFYNGIDSEMFSLKSLGMVLHVPALLIGAEFDKFCPSESVKEYFDVFKDASKVQFEVAEGCGHQCIQENPEWVNLTLSGFIGSY